MKWSKFIQDDTKNMNILPLATKLNTKRSIQKSTSRELKLSSIEKAKRQNAGKLNKTINPQTSREKSFKVERIDGKQSPKPSNVSSFPNCTALSRCLTSPADNLVQIVQRFSKELSEFLTSFLQSIPAIQSNKKLRKEVIQDILESTREVADRFTYEPLTDLEADTVKKAYSCLEVSQMADKSREKSFEKIRLPIVSFKGQKICQQQNSLVRIESSWNQLNNILQSSRKQPKFVRKSNKTRTDKSFGDQSVENLMERSLAESRKIYTSGVKSKDAMYRMNKIMTQ